MARPFAGNAADLLRFLRCKPERTPQDEWTRNACTAILSTKDCLDGVLHGGYVSGFCLDAKTHTDGRFRLEQPFPPMRRDGQFWSAAGLHADLTTEPWRGLKLK